jgi:hypothetical protein
LHLVVVASCCCVLQNLKDLRELLQDAARCEREASAMPPKKRPRAAAAAERQPLPPFADKRERGASASAPPSAPPLPCDAVAPAPPAALSSLRIAECILTLAARRGPDKSICPSEAARALCAGSWRQLMQAVRDAAWELVAQGRLVVTQVRSARFGTPLALQSSTKRAHWRVCSVA